MTTTHLTAANSNNLMAQMSFLNVSRCGADCQHKHVASRPDPQVFDPNSFSFCQPIGSPEAHQASPKLPHDQASLEESVISSAKLVKSSAKLTQTPAPGVQDPRQGSEKSRPVHQRQLRDNQEKISSLPQACERAIKVTQRRLDSIERKLAASDVVDIDNIDSSPSSCLNSTDLERLKRRHLRLQSRLKDLEALPAYLGARKLSFKGFSGWDSSCVLKSSKFSDISQFDSILVEHEDGSKDEIPLDSRIPKFNGSQVDLINKRVQHNNHFHDLWSQETLQSTLDASIQWQMGQDEEGCPCCVAGLDFDEFAAAIKEVSKTKVEADSLIELSTLTDPSHWAIALGVATPFGLIGLAAAIRNVKGSISTSRNLKVIIEGLNNDITLAKESGHLDTATKLSAFKDCLLYSKFDTQFNLVVPGLINGVASSLVLTTTFLSHPLALPAIALYASGQVGRNAFDLVRVAGQHIKIEAGDSLPIIEGKNKVNQIASSKRKFFSANLVGFAAFGTGAALTFLSLPAIGLFGLGTITFPIGLGLLAAGAASTGIMNNIWPRKFKPRNGDLGQPRETFRNPNAILEAISERRTTKKILKSVKSSIIPQNLRYKAWLKFASALPEPRDFLPKRMANKITRFNERWLPFLPALGNQASELKHSLNIKNIQLIHSDSHRSTRMVNSRNDMLARIAGKAPTNQEKDNNQKQALQQCWTHINELGLNAQVLETMIQEGFLQSASQPIPGFNQRSMSWLTFDFEEFLRNADQDHLQAFNSAIDYFLFFKLPKDLQYQQYGLNDYFWALERKLS